MAQATPDTSVTLRRLTLALTLLVLAASCSGHDRLSRAIDDLELPGDLVEVGEDQSGPDAPFAGDYPRVSTYYISQQEPGALCEAMRAWALGEGLAEDSLEEEAFVECQFRGVINSNFLSILVTPARNEIPTGDRSNPG
jgi:hypothetical protein